jgi:hypothetical protein
MSRITKGMLGVRLIVIGTLAASLPAQIQFPGSSGPFPGSGGPGNTGGPFPGSRGGGGGNGGRGRSADPGSGKNRKDAVPLITTTGILRAVAGNQFIVEADDHRIITYKAGHTMTVQKDGKSAELNTFATGDHISVDSTSDDQGFFTATAVTFNTPGTARERAEAARTWDLPNLAASRAKPAAAGKSGADDDRPALRRKDADPPQSATAAAPSAGAAEPDADDNRPTTQVRPSDPVPDADDPGRPQIRRGKPAQRASAKNTEPDMAAAGPVAPAVATATRLADTSAAGSVPVQEDSIVVKARAAAVEFAGSLPNFFCRQLTTRYESDRPKDGWQALDTISADVAYEDGHESYTNVKVGSKAQKSMEDVGGNWSTGEFASLLDDLFDPGTAATFRKTGTDTIAGRGATTFNFEVARERSHWRVTVGGQLYYPAFRGTIWVDRETSRVLRLEMQSRNVPVLFPLSKVEEAVDYEFVRLATAQPFLLPTNSEVLSCDQGSPHCTRNRIEFRNYRKFGAESGITFDQK